MPGKKTPFHTLFCCLLLLLPAFRSGAQWLSLPFERITIEDGLPNPSVLDIIQDRQGFMWFGTLNGIVRYDGKTLQVYHPSDGPIDSLPERDPPTLYLDNQGRIWAGLFYQKTKLFYYDPVSDRFQPFLLPEKHPDFYLKSISTIFQDRKGQLWVGTFGNGLFQLDISKWQPGEPTSEIPITHFIQSPKAPSDEINGRLFEDDNGYIWMPTDGGLYRLNPETGERESFVFKENAAAFDLLFDAPHTLWVATNGLVAFDLKTHNYKYPAPPNSLGSGWVFALEKDFDNRLWLKCVDNISIFDPRSKISHPVRDAASRSDAGLACYALFADYSGNIWIATWQDGIYKYNPDKGRFHFLPHDFYQKSRQQKHHITTVCEDEEGLLWLGTDGDGLVCWNRINDTYRHFRHRPSNANSLSSNEIGSIAAGADGYLWIGTSAGLDRLTLANGTFKRYQSFAGDHSDFSRDNVRISNKGDIWATIWDVGICRLPDQETGRFKCYLDWQLDDLNGRPWLGSIVTTEEDEWGKLWLGSNQNGLWVLDPATEHFEYLLRGYGVHDIHFDRHGQCWLATHSGGLKLWDRNTKRLIHLNKQEQEKIGIARGILEDDQGFLWLKTPNGIIRFDPVKKQVLRQYSTRNWMNKDEFWYGNLPNPAYKTQNGEMFFLSPAGLLYFHPDSVRTDTVPPKIALTEFSLFNEPVLSGADSPLKQHISQTRQIELLHWQNDFAFEFAALHFKSPEENEYSFFLENYDDEWRYAGRNRVAAYTNLDPGYYVFWVKAANSDGVWGEPVAIQIVIHPPWWATWWAYLFYFLTVISVFLGVRRYELNRQRAKDEARRLEELDSVKTRLYTNITHEFRTPLTIILGLSEQLKSQASEGMKTSLDMIRRNGQQLLRLVNQMLDLARVESGHLKLKLVQGDVVNYLQYLLESFQSLAKSKNIRLHFQTKEEKLLMDYDPERLQTIVSNLLSNAIKFTPNGGVVILRVQITQSPNPQILIQVRDTGPGIPEDKLPYVFDRFYQADDSATRGAEGTGIGLTLTRELVKLMQGNISVESAPGKGAEFTVVLPITRTAEKQAVSQVKTGLEHPLEPLPPEKPKALPAQKSKENPLILIAEDNPDVVRYLQTCLQPDYLVEVAYDGQHGVEKALELVPDLIISDVMMPRKDGFEVCYTLKTDERTSHIPVILLTAKADIESRLTGLRRGADAYLAKPFHKEELLVRIQNLLEVRRKMHAHYLALAGLKKGDGSAVAAKASPDEAMEHAFIQKVRALVEADFSTQWQVKQLADKLFVSTSQLHRKLEALTGMHTTEFVRYVRLTAARERLLAQPDEKVSAIAYDVGFENVNEFNRRFKEVFGVTPGEWRKRGG